ncbi:MAG: hypothetical protein LBS09_09655 [Bacteroidales bacterium]|nr:hypothetical protein [Bacteroidales bacterium]
MEKNIKNVLFVAKELEKSNWQLKQQAAELSEAVRVKDLELKNLELKCQNLRFSQTIASSPEDVRRAKLEINRMVREIDKCIALLNR